MSTVPTIPTGRTRDGKPLEACRTALAAGFDLTEVTDHSPEPVIERAREVCRSCPLLVPCRQYALRTVVAGVAGGMTESERRRWARKHHVEQVALDIVDVTPASELTADVLDGLPPVDKKLDPRLIEVVLRMTADGVPAEEIVARLSHTRVTHPTVNYIRRTYAKGVSRVDVV